MTFTDTQTKALAAKLPEKNVKSRVHNGETRHYIEGWHAIAEANRIFGYDAWDRQTLELKTLGQTTSDYRFQTSYLARVRVTVRAGEVIIVREGVGTGHGRSFTAGEAHELAMKSAETDAMKRALATFGNPFGLALYDSEQRGVRATRKPKAGSEGAEPWVLVRAEGQDAARWQEPTEFCAGFREALEAAASAEALRDLWEANTATLERLREAHPQLTSRRGVHYADVLAALYRKRKSGLSAAKPETPALDHTSEAAAEPPPESEVLRLRDRDHLARVAAKPCLVCGRQPAEAHHLRFAQPRAMSRKPGDQFTVPLCRLHHQELHGQGDERAWWQGRRIDALAEAQRLWEGSRPVARVS